MKKIRLTAALAFALCVFLSLGFFTAFADEARPYKIDLSKGVTVSDGTNKETMYPAQLYSDVNSDGKFNAVDARFTLRYSAKLEKTAVPESRMDVNGDGRVSAEDARPILRSTAKLDAYYLKADGTTGLTGLVAAADMGTFYLDKNGALANGIRQTGGGKYLFAHGKYSGGTVYYDGKLLSYASNGAPLTGFANYNGAKYYFNNGEAYSGWVSVGGSWYYCGSDGKVTTGDVTMNGRRYSFDSDGKSRYGKEGQPLEYKTAMIGDSLVAGMAGYSPTDKIDFYGKVGLHTDGVFSKSAPGSGRYLIDEVTGRGYDKVILIIGANDIGYDGSWYKTNYVKAIRGLKERAPGAEIIVHGLMPINESRSYASGYTINMSQINARNAILRQIAAEEGCRYFDPSSAFGTDGGQLPYNAASDGIHFGYDWCVKWAQWLLAQL